MPGEFDVNLHGIALELSITTARAVKDLGELETALTNLEQKVATTAQAALSKFSDSAKTITTQVKDLSRQYADISTTLAAKISPALEEMTEFYEKEKKHIREVVLPFYDRSTKYIGGVLKDTIKVVRGMKGEGTIIDGMIAKYGDVVDTLTRKNVAHTEELELVKKEKEATDKLGAGMRDVGREIDRHRISLRAVHEAYRLIWQTMNSMVNKDLERFHTANYRTIGSMEELVGSVNQLTEQQGLLRDQTLEAHEVMADTRLPVDAMDKYVEIIAKANRVTGVGTAAWGEYASRLRQVGFGADQTNENFTRLILTMRAAKLSMDTMQGMMKSKVSPYMLNKMWGTDTAFEDMQKIQSTFALLGEQMGWNNQQQQAMNDLISQTLGDTMTLNAVASASGKSVRQLLDPGQLHDAYLSIAKQIEETIDREGNAQLVFERYASALHLGSGEMAQMLTLMRDQERKGVGNFERAIKAAEEITKQAKEKAAFEKLYTEAMGNGEIQLKQIADYWHSIVNNLQLYVEGPIHTIVGWMKWMLGGVANLADRFNRWLGVDSRLNKFNAELFQSRRWIKDLVGWGLLLLPVLLAVVTHLGHLAGRLNPVRMITGAIEHIVGRFSQFAVHIIRDVQRVLVAISRAVGMAIQALLRPLLRVIPVMLPLAGVILAVGAAFALAGAGVWLMAQAGDRAIPILLTVGGVLTVMTVTFGLLGMAAVAAAPGLAAVAGVLTAVGVATLLVGAGVALVSYSLGYLINVIDHAGDWMQSWRNVINGVGEAVAGLGRWISDLAGRIFSMDWVRSFFGQIGGAFSGLWAMVSGGFNRLLPGLRAGWGQLVDYVSAALGGVPAIFGRAMTRIGDWFARMRKWVSSILPDLSGWNVSLTGVLGILTSMLSPVGWLVGAFLPMSNQASSIAGRIRDWWNNLNLVETVGGAIRTAWEYIKGLAGGVGGSIYGWWTNAKSFRDLLPSINFQGVIDAAKSVGGYILGWLPSMETIKKGLGGVRDAIGGWLPGMDRVKQGFGLIGQSIAGIPGSIGTIIGKIGEWVLSFDPVSGAIDKIKTAISNLPQILGDMFTGLKAKFDNIWSYFFSSNRTADEARKAQQEINSAMGARIITINAADADKALGDLLGQQEKLSMGIVVTNLALEKQQGAMNAIIEAHARMADKLRGVNLADAIRPQLQSTEKLYFSLEKVIKDNTERATADLRNWEGMQERVIGSLDQNRGKLNERVRADSIISVQTRTDREESRITPYWAQDQNQYLRQIVNYLGNPENARNLSTISELLKQHLPKIAQDDPISSDGLTSVMNNYGS